MIHGGSARRACPARMGARIGLDRSFWGMGSSPWGPRPANAVRAVLGSVIAIGFAWLVASFVPLYELLGRGADPAGGVRYLPVAYCVAWVGIALSVVAVGIMVVEKIRYRRRVAWVPLLAVPLVAESWLLGFLLAVVLVSI
ncbi:hypothetical protein ACQP1G_45180 [Nocardia sp. CA-107356]|uniref:hypothetical protein n=1 Tax=Nocardia sp. CA-107356 TaxID=3239972 RepID=UPI003D8BE3AE